MLARLHNHPDIPLAERSRPSSLFVVDSLGPAQLHASLSTLLPLQPTVPDDLGKNLIPARYIGQFACVSLKRLELKPHFLDIVTVRLGDLVHLSKIVKCETPPCRITVTLRALQALRAFW